MYRLEHHSDATVVYVRDAVGARNRSTFEETLESALTRGAHSLIVSLEDCASCDSTVLGVLVNVQRRVSSRLTVILPDTGACRRLFNATGLSRLMHCVPTLDAALRYRPAQPAPVRR